MSLIIGGTGMLATVTHWVAAHSKKILLVSRHASSFAARLDNSLPIEVDWDCDQFAETVTPPVALGISDRMWSLEELVEQTS